MKFSFHSVRDHVSRPHKAAGKITILFILILIFTEGRKEGKKILVQIISSISWLQ
jgi:hypothetical protein